jgi:hypothetical protein
MAWLIRRACVVWAILLAMCAGIVGIVRAQGGLDRLQAMGFGVCEGEPCFRGIKVGMDWAAARRLRSESSGKVAEDSPLLIFVPDKNTGNAIVVNPTEDGKTVSSITFESNSSPTSWPSAADVIQRFGYPCGVFIAAWNEDGTGGIFLIYPKMTTYIAVQDSRLSLDSPSWSLIIQERNSAYISCLASSKEYKGPWYGFTLLKDVYRARNRRALSISPMP